MPIRNHAARCRAAPPGARRAAALAALGALVPTPADAARGIEGSLSLVSEYRYRGERQAKGPALQAEAEAQLDGGWSLGLWGSTLGRLSPRRLEIDLSAGRTLRRGRTSLGLFGDVVAYTGGGGSYVQARALVTRAIGKAALELELSGAPQGGRAASILYSGVTASIPLTPAFTASAHGGVDPFDGGRVDLAAAGAWQRGPFTVALTATAITLARRAPRPALFLSVSRTFE